MDIKKLLPKLWRQPQKEYLFSRNFYKNPSHQWIFASPKIKRVFDVLIDCIAFDKSIDQELAKRGAIVFLPSNATLSCTINTSQFRHNIIVFPDLFDMIFSASPIRAAAVLAHELGHIYYQHDNNPKKLSTLECQLEADEFACQLGLSRDLQQVLCDYDFDIDTKVRISRITSHYFNEKSQHN